MKKKLKITAAICLLTFCLTGCFPTGKLNESSTPSAPALNSESTDISNGSESGSNISSSAPKRFEKEIENYLKMEITLPDGYPKELPVIKATNCEFDAETAKALFIDGKTIYRDDSREGRTDLHTTDGAALYLNTGDITFEADAHLFDGENEKRSTFMMQWTAAQHVATWPTVFTHAGDELEGFPRSEALERANELVKKLDIKYLGEPQIYAITAEDSHSFDNDIVLAKEDECYLVRYLTTYNGISIPVGAGEVFDGVGNETSKLDIVLKKDKLLIFQGRNIYGSIEEIGTAQISCSADTALSRLYDYFDMQVDRKNRFECDGIGFAYVTSAMDYDAGEFTYRPVWRVSGIRFSSSNKYSTDIGLTHYNFIDPASGTVFWDQNV